MPTANTVLLSTSNRGIRAAAALLAAGELVAFPTETVYGLGADATHGRAVAGIFSAKGRPQFNPLIVHVADIAAAEDLVTFAPTAKALAQAFWPGPLTLVLPRREGRIADLVTAGLDTVAIRVPAHPVAQAILRAFGGPVAAPSANPSGRISPTNAAHVMSGLGGRIAAVVDGGPCEVGVESTIIGFDGDDPVLLRPGGITDAQIAAACGRRVKTAWAGDITAPGQLASHYAPAVALRLNAEAPEADELWLGFGPLHGRNGLSLSETCDLHEAAANLFSHLHALDAKAQSRGFDKLAVAPIPDSGLGRAINDRLRRAAAPRSGASALG